MIGKLEAYGLDMVYLANRKKRTKLGSSYYDWFKFIHGILQGTT